MKGNIICTSVLLIITSCKSKITNINITASIKDENYKCFIYNGEKPDYQEPLDTIYFYKPVSFKLENNTNCDIKITTLADNFHAGAFKPHIINSIYYQYLTGPKALGSGNSIEITLFVHLPVPISLLDKVNSDRLLKSYYNGRYDSIVISQINPNLQIAIDSLLKKKEIIIHYNENKNLKEKAMAIYCVDKKHLAVFRMDSIAKLKEGLKYNCN